MRHLVVYLIISCIAFAGAVGQAARPSEPSETPLLEELAQAAERREKLLDTYDATVLTEVRNPGDKDAFLTATTRWIKQHEKVRAEEVQGIQLTNTEHRSYETVLAFDGQLGRAYSPLTRRGSVFRDTAPELQKLRGQPDKMICVVPETGSILISSMLREQSIASSKEPKRLVPKTRVIGRGEEAGEAVVIVETSVNVSVEPTVSELWRYYFAERLNYAPIRIDNITDNGNHSLGSRMLMRKFVTQNGIPIPMELEYLVYRGEQAALQSTLVKIQKILWSVEVAPAFFKLEFPPGTQIGDLVVGVGYTAGGRDMPSDQELLSATAPSSPVVKVPSLSAPAGGMAETPQPYRPDRFHAILGVALTVAGLVLLYAVVVSVVRWRKRAKTSR